MMSISPMGAGSSIENYYCNLAREDYYTKGGEPPGVWFGNGAKVMGLNGIVKVEQLRQTMKGQSPYGSSMVQGSGDEHRAGWDCTFSAPKSVSIAWAISSVETRQAIANAQAKAVETALKFIEQHACHARRGKAGSKEEKVSGIIAATFEHGTSREGDPQLHTHCLLQNLAQRADGSWGCIESLRLYQWKMAAGAIYRAELASQMKSMGFAIERDKESFRLTSMPRVAEKLFSKRRNQIEEKLAEKGFNSAVASQIAALDTRHHKTEVDRSKSLLTWEEQAKTVGLTSLILESFKQQSTPTLNMPTHSELLAVLTKQASTFKEEDIYRHAALAAQGILNAQNVKSYVAALMRNDQLVTLDKDQQGIQRFTSKEMLAIEQGIANIAVYRSKEIKHHASKRTVNQTIIARPTITNEQINALDYITRRSGGVACVQGIAGSGKSFLMDACREIFEKSQFRVTGCALSGKAAQGLQDGSKIQSQTLHSLLDQLGKGKLVLTNKDIIVLDEAGMVGSRQFASLMHYVDLKGAKLVAIGDTRQLQPIDAGGAFRILISNIEYAELKDIFRQESEIDRQVVRDLAEGNALEAIASMDERGLVKNAPDIQSVMNTLVDDWNKDGIEIKHKLILSGTRSEANMLNNLVRDALAKDGKIGAVNADVEISNGNNRQFSEGGRLLFTRNNLELGVKNGTLGTLKHITLNRHGECEMTVITDDGKSVRFSPSANGGYNHIEHGYAMSVHKAQGVTVSRSYLLASEIMGDREWAYVGASRARETTQLYCTSDFKKNLVQVFSKTRQKNSSLDFQNKNPKSHDILELE
jgi:Ti-type conjugative transfer relaxase TraA